MKIIRRQIYELTCSQCTSRELISWHNMGLRCKDCHTTAHPLRLRALNPPQTEFFVMGGATDLLIAGDQAVMTPGHAYEFNDMTMRCPSCTGESHLMPISNDPVVVLCKDCFESFTLDELMIESSEVVRYWWAQPRTGGEGGWVSRAPFQAGATS